MGEQELHCQAWMKRSLVQNPTQECTTNIFEKINLYNLWKLMYIINVQFWKGLLPFHLIKSKRSIIQWINTHFFHVVEFFFPKQVLIVVAFESWGQYHRQRLFQKSFHKRAELHGIIKIIWCWINHVVAGRPKVDTILIQKLSFDTRYMQIMLHSTYATYRLVRQWIWIVHDLTRQKMSS